MSFVSDVVHSLRRRCREAARLRGIGDIAVMAYDSLLRYFPAAPLLMRGTIHQVGIRNNGPACFIRLGYSDGSMFEDICVRGIYDAVIRAKLTDVCQIIDLGANIGVTLRLWAHQFRQAKIIAVEPDESNLDMCRRNTAPDENRITLIRGFAAGQSGDAYLQPGHLACTHTMVLEAPTTEPAIRAYTIPEILKQGQATGPIDLLKCDIEGSEQQLFADCADWIGLVKNLIIELHPPYSRELFLADLSRGGSRLNLVWSDNAPVHPLLFLSVGAAGASC